MMLRVVDVVVGNGDGNDDGLAVAVVVWVLISIAAETRVVLHDHY